MTTCEDQAARFDKRRLELVEGLSAHDQRPQLLELAEYPVRGLRGLR
jgi:hypothetical protein